MPDNLEYGSRKRRNSWRLAAWATAATLLLLPWFAMQITDQVVWDAADFAFFAALLVGAGVAYELTASVSGSKTYRAATAIALAAAFILVWINAAVGLIGSEDNPANLLFFGVLALGIVGALIARFRPHGMAHTLFAMALAQALIAVVAMVAGWGVPASGPLELAALNGFFVALWLLSAWLFRKAAREPAYM